MSILIETNPTTFLFLTIIIGGSAAYVSGRAIAITWRPRWQLVLYILLIGCVIRFFYFALFEGSLLSLQYYLKDTLFLLIFGFLGYQITRAKQIVTHYGWLYKKSSPLSWSEK